MTTSETMTVLDVIRQAVRIYHDTGKKPDDILRDRYALKNFAEMVASGDKDPYLHSRTASEVLAGIVDSKPKPEEELRDALNDLIVLATQYVRYTGGNLGTKELADAERILADFDAQQRKEEGL